MSHLSHSGKLVWPLTHSSHLFPVLKRLQSIHFPLSSHFWDFEPLASQSHAVRKFKIYMNMYLGDLSPLTISVLYPSINKANELFYLCSLDNHGAQVNICYILGNYHSLWHIFHILFQQNLAFYKDIFQLQDHNCYLLFHFHCIYRLIKQIIDRKYGIKIIDNVI